MANCQNAMRFNSPLPDNAMKVAPLAVAAALTRVVLLQPGGPCSSTPLHWQMQEDAVGREVRRWAENATCACCHFKGAPWG